MLFKMRASSHFQTKAEMLTQSGGSSKGQQEVQCELRARRVCRCTVQPPSFLTAFTKNLAQIKAHHYTQTSSRARQYRVAIQSMVTTAAVFRHDMSTILTYSSRTLVDSANLCFFSSTFIRSVLQIFSNCFAHVA